VVHAYHEGLATRGEAVKWFAMKPAKAANVIPLATVAKM
jgi:hypothetical protein